MVEMRIICKHCIGPEKVVVLPGARTKHLKEKHGIEIHGFQHADHFDLAEIELGNYAKVK